MRNENVSDEISITLQYPHNDKFEYFTRLERINLDEVRKDDISCGKGFIIDAPMGIKKDIKLQNGIFSSRYGGADISDIDSFNGRYRCKCGMKRGSINHGEFCEFCHTRVSYMGDDISIMGYLVLKEPYYIIHPNMYRSLEAFITADKLDRIIDGKVVVDSDGKEIPLVQKKKDEPFQGIGILEFKARFDEVMNFYLKKYPAKQAYYDDIMKHRNLIFTQSIAVFSSLLRPSKLDNGSLRYESCNDQFNMLATLVYVCNNDKLRMNRKRKEKYMLLYDIQCQYNSIYNELKNILSKKKGDVRSALGGRYVFSSRTVIKQDTQLQCDEIKLPFYALNELLQQVIINILVKTYHFNHAEAYKKWYRSQVTGKDPVIWDIIEGLIHHNNGLPVLINRNPTISFGGILCVRCIGITPDFTMSISLQVLVPLVADFDGDTLNELYLYNKDFIKAADVVNPRQMFISRNDGKCDAGMLHERDVIINANALKTLSKYTPEEIAQIKYMQSLDI